tara:strand:+ start:956 stop:1762 length:807 start_codon:yes stop_codon:yes gene_type:complete
MNKICVVTFVYPGLTNKFKKFLQSLNQQTNQNFDLIIFSNNLKNLTLPNNDFKIRLIKLNSGIIKSRFEMIKYLKKIDYQYIVFQDADDTMSPNRIELVCKKLKKNHIVVNDLDIIFNKKIIKNYFSKRIINNAILNAKDIINFNFMGMSNTAIRKKCLNEISFPRRLNIEIFDWYFWTIILSKYKARFINSTSTQYYVRSNSTTCLPTNSNPGFLKKISLIIKIHKKTIDTLIKNKIIKDIKHFNKSKKINNNKKNNFWWELNVEKN